jgi:hypothetical protein
MIRPGQCECGGDLKYYDGALGYEAMICLTCREHWGDQNEAERLSHLERYRRGERNSNQLLNGGWMCSLGHDGRTATIRFADENYASHVCRLDQQWICDEHNVSVQEIANLIRYAPELKAMLTKMVVALGDSQCMQDLAQEASDLLRKVPACARPCKCGRYYGPTTVFCLYCNDATPWASGA